MKLLMIAAAALTMAATDDGDDPFVLGAWAAQLDWGVDACGFAVDEAFDTQVIKARDLNEEEFASGYFSSQKHIPAEVSCEDLIRRFGSSGKDRPNVIRFE